MKKSRLSHIASTGEPRMVDVGNKVATERIAVAEGRIRMSPTALAAIRAGHTKKGDVLAVAQLAGIMAAKRTADLIPLCHPLSLNGVEVEASMEDDPPAIRVRGTVRVEAKTGVEMEALTAVSCALLTVYDMCKGIDRTMTITDLRLLRKEGGRSGAWSSDPETGL